MSFFVTVDRYTGQIVVPDYDDGDIPDDVSFVLDIGGTYYGHNNGDGRIFVDTWAFVNAYRAGLPQPDVETASVHLQITYRGNGRFDVNEYPESDVTSESERSNTDPDSDSTDDEYRFYRGAREQADDTSGSDDDPFYDL